MISKHRPVIVEIRPSRPSIVIAELFQRLLKFGAGTPTNYRTVINYGTRLDHHFTARVHHFAGHKLGLPNYLRNTRKVRVLERAEP